jgi:DNA-binding MarR family transcriptional regulator
VSDEVIDSLEAIAIGSVAITNIALSRTGGAGLSFEQWRAILLVGDHGDGIRMSSVARAVGVTLPATTRLLRRLVDRGLLTLERDPTDSRARLVQLTPEGRDLRRRVLDDRRHRLAQVAMRADLHGGGAVDLDVLAAAFRDVEAAQEVLGE